MPTLHLMVGLPCSGKTTLAKQIEAQTGALRLTPDEWHRFLYGQDAEHPEHDARHEKIEALQWDIAEKSLKQGVDVILDFGLWAKVERQDFRQRALGLGASSYTHVMDAPMSVLLERLDIRNLQAGEQVTVIPPSFMAEYAKHFELPDTEELAKDAKLYSV